MGAPEAEVIGDPVAYSRSPAIHKTWLSALGIQGDYLATLVRASALADHIACRRDDPDWRGCNVTMPHKQAILPLLDHVDDAAQSSEARRVGKRCVSQCRSRWTPYK